MIQRQRYFSDNDAEALLSELWACRRACEQAQGSAPTGGHLYRGCEILEGALDEMAFILAGDRRRLWHRVPTTPDMHQRD